MSDDPSQNPLDFLQDLTFAPGWAKEPPKKQTAESFHSFDEDRGDRRPGRGGRDGFRGPRRDGDFRPPRRDGDFRGPRRDGDSRPPRRDGDFRGPRRDGDSRPPRREGDFRGPRREGEDRPPRREGEEAPRRDFRRDAPRAPRVDLAALPVEVRYLPDQKEMGIVIRKVQGSSRAYPIRDLARLFLEHPSSCDVRLEVRPEHPEMFLHQCTRCGYVTTSPEALSAHMLQKHFDEEFVRETIVGDPPSGTFSCVARCGVSGRLIGPPNHHSYAQRLRDMMHEVAPGMSEDAYRRALVMEHDPAVIEQWKEEARTQVVYKRRPKAEEEAPKAEGKKRPAHSDAAAESPTPAAEPAEHPDADADSPAAPAAEPAEHPDAAGESPDTPAAPAAEEPALDRAMAEAVFLRDIAPKFTTGRKRASCSFEAAKAIDDPNIAPAVREVWQQEQRSPLSLFIALRGAFRAKRFHVFRAVDARGMEFVMSKAPTALDESHAVPELARCLQFVREHRGCTRGDLFADLGIPEGERTPEQERLYQQFAWLVESAHLVEYHNGVLALPEEHPHFRQLPRPRPAAASGSPKAEESPKAAEPLPPESETAGPETAESAPAEEPPPEAAPESPPAESVVDEPAVPPAGDEPQP